MRLGVYSMQKVLFNGEAVSVNCNTKAGEITILDHHQPLISILAKGTIKIVDTEKKEHYIPVSSGFVKVAEDVKFLVEEENAG